MKKSRCAYVFILIVVSFFLMHSSLAAGNLTVQEENLFIVKTILDDQFKCEYAALLKNTGNETAMLAEGSFKLLDSEGKILFETSGFMKMYPQVLNAGETGVLTISGSMSEAVSPDNAFNHELELVSSHVGNYPAIVRFPVSFTLSYEKSDMPLLAISVHSEVINITESPVYSFGWVAVIRDEDRDIYAITDEIDFASGLAAGSAIWVGRNFNFNQASYFFQKNKTPLSVEVFAFMQINE